MSPVPSEVKTEPTSDIRGFVYVVESPRADDLYNGRLEGPALTRILDLSHTRIRTAMRVAVNGKHLEQALDEARILLPENRKKDGLPVLHLSCHGSKDGIVVGEERVKWAALADKIRPINEALNGALILSMSACSGVGAMYMGKQYVKGAPFGVLVGPTEKISWQEGLVAFATLYHLLFNQDASMEDAVAAMNMASRPGTAQFLRVDGKELVHKWAKLSLRNLFEQMEQL